MRGRTGSPFGSGRLDEMEIEVELSGRLPTAR